MSGFPFSIPRGSVVGVDAAAMQWFWKILFPESHACAPFPPITVSVDQELIADACGPSVDTNGLYVRCVLLAQMVHAGLLKPWQEAGRLDDAVSVMAAYPISDLDHFAPESFIMRLEEMDPPTR